MMITRKSRTEKKTNMLFMLIIVAFLSGSIYGLGWIPIILYLNTKSIRSLGVTGLLSVGLITYYAVICFLPFLFMETGVYLFVSSDINLVANTAFGVMLLVLTATVYININRYREVCSSKAATLLNVYLYFLISAFIVLVAVYKWRHPDLWFLGVLYGVMVLVTLVICRVLLKRRFSAQDNRISTQDVLELKAGQLIEDRKVVWFGIDSATWHIMDDLMCHQKLPNLSALKEKGSFGRLKTFKPTFSPVLWTSKATGKTPRKHGVKNFITYRFKGMRGYLELIGPDPILAKLMTKIAQFGLIKREPVTSCERTALAIWNILSDFGYKVGVLSWFLTDPAEKINGVMIPEFFYTISEKVKLLTSSRPYPPEIEDDIFKIKKRIKERFNSPDGTREVRERFCIDGDLTPEEQRNFEVLKAFYFHDVLRRDLLYHFADIHDFNLTMVYFHGIDAVQHRFWDCHNKTDSKFRHVISRYYEFVDHILGELLEKIEGRKTVFVTSDHGHESTKKSSLLLQRLLGRPQVPGSHSEAPDGIFIAAGEDIKPGGIPDNITIYDIVPTILPLFGLPVGMDMDGRAVAEIYTEKMTRLSRIDSYEGLPTVKLDDSCGLEENEDVLKRLRDLGYID